jgi:hypothetical protein
MSWAAFELRILANRSESWRISFLVVNNVLDPPDQLQFAVIGVQTAPEFGVHQQWNRAP